MDNDPSLPRHDTVAGDAGQQLWESKEDLSPAAWDLSAAPPPSPIAVPGRTKLT